MKKILTILTSVLLASAAWADVVTLDMSKPLNPASIEYGENGLWTGCYNDVDYTWLEFGGESGEFLLSHLIDGEGASWGGYYWDGFTPATGGDTSNHVNDGWTKNFGGCMAGGGCVLNNDGTVSADASKPYFVAYYSSWAQEGPSNQVKFVDKDGNEEFEPVGVYICNHPWAYYDCLEGEGAARALDQEGDYFEIVAHGVAADGSEKTVKMNLATFTNGELIAVNDWTFFDLSSLGKVKSVYFTLNSTDVGDWGMNTAAYFCMDKFQVKVFEPVVIDVTPYTGAWKSDLGNVGNYSTHKEQYNGSTAEGLGKVLYQTFTDLDAGTYTVTLEANASSTGSRDNIAGKITVSGDLARVQVYANDVEKTIPTIIQTAVGTNNIVELANVVVGDDGILELGMRKDIGGTNWHTIQITGLTWESPEAIPDEEAATAYWQGVRDDILALEAYVNVQGDERAAVEAATNEQELLAAVPTFYAAKAEADAAALLAEREAAYADASEDNPMVTDFVVNPSFNDGIAPWKSTTGAQNQALANNQTAFPNLPFYENWNPSNYTGKMYQEILGVPNGLYELKMWAFSYHFDGAHQFVFANGDKTALTQGAPKEYTVRTIVIDNKIEIGLMQDAAINEWMGLDDAVLSYLGKVDDKAALADAISSADEVNISAPMNGTVSESFASAYQAAVSVYNDDAATKDEIINATLALQEATSAAAASVSSYATANNNLAAMKRLTETTNFYTEEDYEDYYGQWNQKYEARTLTTEEANALQDPFVATGWHDSVTVDNFLLSAWDTNPDFPNGVAYYINTWSHEGEGDGTNFLVPFFEYWTREGDTLGEKSLTATMTNMDPGTYKVTAWVRVRYTDGSTDAPYGISMKVGDGEAVNVCAGTSVDNSQFYIGEFTAEGVVGEDGVLTFSFDVAAENNVSWLSFQNVMYKPVEEIVEDPNDFTYLIENPAYLHKGDGGTADYAGWTWNPAPGESGWKYRNYGEPMNLVTYSGNVNFSFYQIIPEVPIGQYRLSVYGFYRPGSLEDEATRVANGDPVHNLQMFAEIGDGIYTQDIMNLYEGATEENVIGKDFHPMVEGYQDRYCPDGAVDSRSFFIAGEYRNDLILNITEAGPVKIGITHTEERTYDSDYAPIGGWELYRTSETPDENTTPIEATFADQNNSAEKMFFDLSGRRVNSVKKGGMYIVRSAEGRNNKIVVVK